MSSPLHRPPENGERAILTLAMKMSLAVYEKTPPPGVAVYTGDSGCHLTVSELGEGPIVIAFRGSDSLVDWMFNLAHFKTTGVFLQHSRVHAGFLLQYEDIRFQLLDDLALRICPHMFPRILLVTGHSSGGALATLCALDLARKYPTMTVDCRVFGSPRVGDASFVELVKHQHNLSVQRTSNRFDLISQVPYFGFVHLPNVRILDDPDIRWFQFWKSHDLQQIYARYSAL